MEQVDLTKELARQAVERKRIIAESDARAGKFNPALDVYQNLERGAKQADQLMNEADGSMDGWNSEIDVVTADIRLTPNGQRDSLARSEEQRYGSIIEKLRLALDFISTGRKSATTLSVKRPVPQLSDEIDHLRRVGNELELARRRADELLSLRMVGGDAWTACKARMDEHLDAGDAIGFDAVYYAARERFVEKPELRQHLGALDKMYLAGTASPAEAERQMYLNDALAAFDRLEVRRAGLLGRLESTLARVQAGPERLDPHDPHVRRKVRDRLSASFPSEFRNDGLKGARS